MKPDGTEQTQLTFTSDWQEGEAYFLPDSETVIFRAWKNSEKNRLEEEARKNGTRRNPGCCHDPNRRMNHAAGPREPCIAKPPLKNMQ